MGRKAIPYDPDVAREIISRIIAGETLRGVCEDEDIPSKDVVYGWLALDQAFSDAYARAREHQVMQWADEIIEIADDSLADFIETVGADGEVDREFNTEHVQRSRLRIDARKWVMSKVAPRVFGDKIDVNMTAKVTAVSGLSDEELEKRVTAHLRAIGVEAAGPILLGSGLVAKPPTDGEGPSD